MLNVNDEIQISASIVLYNEQIEVLEKTINCFLAIPVAKRLFLIDNTTNSNYKSLSNNEAVCYIENKENIGFGAGHNKVLQHIKDVSSYHLILNPDVFFKADIIKNLSTQLLKFDDVAMIAPSVTFPNGEKQYTVRKYPNAIDLVSRKLNIFKKRIYNHEYRDRDLSKPFYPEAIHGCFMLFKTADFVELGGFDERYFLYMEDIDICKQIDASGKKKMYFPEVEITHVLKQESSKSIKLFLRHLSSAIKYFLKWS